MINTNYFRLEFASPHRDEAVLDACRHCGGTQCCTARRTIRAAKGKRKSARVDTSILCANGLFACHCFVATVCDSDAHRKEAGQTELKPFKTMTKRRPSDTLVSDKNKTKCISRSITTTTRRTKLLCSRQYSTDSPTSDCCTPCEIEHTSRQRPSAHQRRRLDCCPIWASPAICRTGADDRRMPFVPHRSCPQFAANPPETYR